MPDRGNGKESEDQYTGNALSRYPAWKLSTRLFLMVNCKGCMLTPDYEREVSFNWVKAK